MFAKLLKHEWKSSSKILGLLSLAALGAGIVGTILLQVQNHIPNNSIWQDISTTVFGPIMTLVVVTLIAYIFGSMIYLVYRFYKNKFTDEGYLTFTLPVTTRQIFLASLVNMTGWIAIVYLVVILDALLMMLLGVRMNSINRIVLEGLPDFLRNVGYGGMLYLVVATAHTCVLAMTSITVGNVVAKKHKVLAAFGVYYLMNFVIENVVGIMVIITECIFNQLIEDFLGSMSAMLITRIFFYLILIAGGYFLSTHLMKNKLNLP